MSASNDVLLPYIQHGWTGVEIGVGEGDSAVLWMKHGVRFLWLIDPWGIPHPYPDPGGQARYETAMQRLSPYAGKHSHLRMTSKEAAQHVHEPVDFVYIDGDHRYEWCKDDMERYWPKIRPGGVLCGHDYCTSGELCQVERAVNEFVADRGLSLVTFPNGSSCWMIQK